MINKIETFENLEVGTKIIRFYTNDRPDILGVIGLDQKNIKVMHHLSNKYNLSTKTFEKVLETPIINSGTNRPVKHYFNPSRYYYTLFDDVK